MYYNNPKYKNNKGIEFLKIEKSKVLIGLLILRFKTNRKCMGIMARKIKSTDIMSQSDLIEAAM